MASKVGSRLTKGGLVVTTVGALAISVVGENEGLKLYAYKDVVGVWTACYGETKGIKPGMKFTKKECDVMFIDSLTKHEKGMRECLNNPDAIPEKVYVSALDLTYNVGVGAFCGSKMKDYLNAENYKAACNSLSSWVKAGGRTIAGLVNRRERVKKICLAGV